MATMSLDDAMFLHGESAGRPAHVIALQLFKLPNGAAPDHLAQMYQDLLVTPGIKDVFRKHPKRSLTAPSRLQWVDEGWDADYHIRRSALPTPARVRELLEAVSLQHGVSLDRNRPLWEYHLFEGLEGNRFAAAFKAHHALADGISLAGHILGGLSPDVNATDCTPPWVESRAGVLTPPVHPAEDSTNLLNAITAPVRLTGAAIKTLRSMARDTNATLPYQAPRSMFNVGIGGARRFAGNAWSHDRLKAVATAAGCRVNDVVLAMCGATLREFMLELDALPDRSLIAMVPISLRRADTNFAAGEGNKFGAILCDLQTTESDPVARLERISATMTTGKERMAGLSTAEAMAVSRLIMGGAALGSLTGITATPRQPFNLIISNVTASSKPLYWNGAEMTDLYPISMISEGQALNITVTRYADSMTFGIVGDRKAVPHLQRMLNHLDNALGDLEKALGIAA